MIDDQRDARGPVAQPYLHASRTEGPERSHQAAAGALSGYTSSTPTASMPVPTATPSVGYNPTLMPTDAGGESEMC